MLRIVHHLIQIIVTEEPTNDINGSVSATEKNFSIDFSKARTNFLKFKANKKNKKLSYSILLRIYIQKMWSQNKYHLKQMFMFFSVNYDPINKSQILNINKYSMGESNIKSCKWCSD